ncbi:MAG: hypothetical protein KKB50_02420 [Planctomycetes bacterium]|nr:hypothetical protein [Planctomycetota bacterium]
MDDIVAHNITGTVTVGGDVLHTIDITDDITAGITIDGPRACRMPQRPSPRLACPVLENGGTLLDHPSEA